MYRLRKILPGNYVRKEVKGVWYIVGDEKDIKPQPMQFLDNHKSQMIEDFISIDVENSEEILCFTKKYEPIICMGLEGFKEAAKIKGENFWLILVKDIQYENRFLFLSINLSIFMS